MLFAGLTAVAFGTGLFKPDTNALRGNLYNKDNLHLKDNDFNIAYMGVNIGAALSPWAALLLRQAYNKNTGFFVKFGIDNYHACFALAGIGMIVALIISTLEQKNYNDTDQTALYFELLGQKGVLRPLSSIFLAASEISLCVGTII